MREPPAHVSDEQVLVVVRLAWDHEVDEVRYLPVGFGAHHWAASSRPRRTSLPPD